MREKFNKILGKFKELEKDFQSNQGIILTEYDLQCLIFHKLYDLFKHDSETLDTHVKGSPLHSELKFFNENGKLFDRPDIIIIQPDNYSILHSTEFRMTENGIKFKKSPSKQYAFSGDLIIIELKFCRAKNGITKIESFKKDFEKIRRIKQLIERNSGDKVYGLLAVFNKTDKKSRQFKEFLMPYSNGDEIQIIYYSGKVEF